MSEQTAGRTAGTVEVADFDAFFAEQATPVKRGVPLKLYGRTSHLPAKLPALFSLQLHRVQESARPQDIRGLLAALFGPDAVDHWTEQGMPDDRLGVVLMWATANTAEPGSLSMARAAELYAEKEAAKGKALRPCQSRPKGQGKGKGKKPRSSGKRS